MKADLASDEFSAVALLSRVSRGEDEGFAITEPGFAIELQQRDCCTTLRGERHNGCAFEAKVRLPPVAPRMIQVRNLSGFGVEGGKIGAFEPVTFKAGQRQILQDRRAAMLKSKDVVHLMRQETIVGADKAVFASALSPLPDCLAQDWRNHSDGLALFSRWRRASALMRINK